MEVRRLCEAIRQRVALELSEVADPGARSDLLIDALYEVSRCVLPELGPPRKSEEYLEDQALVLDLITFLAIPLVRAGAGERRGVAVLSEIAEGCQDPQLKKKFSIYAQELLARSRRNAASGYDARNLVPWLIGLVGVGVLALYLSWPNAEPVASARAVAVAPTCPVPPAPAAAEAPAHASAAIRPGADGAPAREADAAEHEKDDRNPEGRGTPSPRIAGSQGGAGAQGGAASGEEQTMRVRIVNNQVLVPVTLKNGGGSVRVELLLDTGATRTAIHESVAGKLPLDLNQARSSQAIVADGRVVRSRLAKIESVLVGPFAMNGPEVELIPYHGEDNVHDGLLGMDFLGRHRYQIDMEHQVIRWF